jgi:hypothetical protein
MTDKNCMPNRSKTMSKLYTERDIIEQGDYYSCHTSAMTSEGLDRKSDIAAELAHRDIQIDQLQAKVAELEGKPTAIVNDSGVLEWYPSYNRLHAGTKLYTHPASCSEIPNSCDQAVSVPDAEYIDQLEAQLAQQAMSKPKWSDWIDWHATADSVCPLEDGVLHQVIFSDGNKSFVDGFPETWAWNAEELSITAYRYKLANEPTKANKWIKCSEQRSNVLDVWIKMTDGSVVACWSQLDGDFYWNGGGSESYILENTVTHWKPRQQEQGHE